MPTSMTTRVEERRMATSVLVIGTGAAGLRAAIELAERGVEVLCVGKRRRDDAHTVLASGGINAALGTMDPDRARRPRRRPARHHPGRRGDARAHPRR
jgi:succinate dehydrogenase / fumarate reductase flavoprotein subunit